MSLDHEAIYKAYSDVVRIDDKDGALKEDGTQVTLVQSNIDAARVELDKLNYIEHRVGTATTSGYDTITNQFDQLYHDMKDGKLGVAATTGSWYVGITSVKTLYPKP